MDPDRVDLSALDPSRDPARWEAMVRRTAARGLARRRASVASQIAAWSRPALALAAGVALVVWTGTLAYTPTAESDPAGKLLEWASTDSSPATSEILETLGSRHAAR